ncbi:MAG: putative selenate reductase subunit YgfK [Chloroflexota bacterium]|nr:MAG: putative selenate reductase subunit YgfK [Chloroflexota bacterium]
MSDVMQPIPFQNLLNWILEEYKSEGAIFGIQKDKFYYKKDDVHFRLFGEKCETPIGPAAGPHTQVAQNLVTAYLTGGRFFELKTVQIMDTLEIEKPCIDAEKETYNTEWSTELTVPQAYDEYVKAWFLLHVLNKMLGISTSEERAFVFNMSVGYDLEGLKTPKMDNFIEGLKDASDAEIFQTCQAELKIAIQEGKIPRITDANFADEISPRISNSVTLSTMHGTPPEDQEAICKYLIGAKNLNTFVKLNPTLHGYAYVKAALENLGYDEITLKEETFTHDMQYAAAVKMVRNLLAYAKECGVEFGVKLSNTLAVVNDKGTLPTNEMYMSGRALYPLTINLALKLAQEFDGNLAISYSGGADRFNIADILAAGLKPITMATYLLKPGGYARMTQLAELLKDEQAAIARTTIDLEKLAQVAKDALENPRYSREAKPDASMKIGGTLEMLDCFVAPCTVGCPIGQDVPEYIRLIGEERYAEAYELIISKNAFPFITGFICDHQCQIKCVRNDYENSLLIRDLKRIAAEKGFATVIENIPPFEKTHDAKIAIIGAGPAGLSAAYFLAREGFEVTVFDKTDRAGGMVAHGIPGFRFPEWALENDLTLIKRAGVKLELNCDPQIDVEKLKAEGFKYIHLAIGAWKSRALRIEGSQENVHGAINFLQTFKRNPQSLQLGKTVAIIGGGNSAMDSARAATRVSGVEKVLILYRRTKKQMPADHEELQNAAKDGVIFHELVSPLSLENGVLKCQVMELGEKDASGRRRPTPIAGKFAKFKVDTILTAIGELVDYDILKANGIQVDEKGNIAVNQFLETSVENVFIGGDAYHGPATVVKAIADGRKVADGILAKESVTQRTFTPPAILFDDAARAEAVAAKKAILTPQPSPAVFDVEYPAETRRCLECNFICNKCVEVCPNRANVAVTVSSSELQNHNQILHLDALCNECGNCETFCPHNGAPYRDKFTLFWDEESFQENANAGFLFITDTTLKMRYHEKIYPLTLEEGQIVSADSALRDNKEAQGLFAIILAVKNRYPYLLKG